MHLLFYYAAFIMVKGRGCVTSSCLLYSPVVTHKVLHLELFGFLPAVKSSASTHVLYTASEDQTSGKYTVFYACVNMHHFSVVFHF